MGIISPKCDSIKVTFRSELKCLWQWQKWRSTKQCQNTSLLSLWVIGKGEIAVIWRKLWEDQDRLDLRGYSKVYMTCIYVMSISGKESRSWKTSVTAVQSLLWKSYSCNWYCFWAFHFHSSLCVSFTDIVFHTFYIVFISLNCFCILLPLRREVYLVFYKCFIGSAKCIFKSILLGDLCGYIPIFKNFGGIAESIPFRCKGAIYLLTSFLWNCCIIYCLDQGVASKSLLGHFSWNQKRKPACPMYNVFGWVCG